MPANRLPEKQSGLHFELKNVAFAPPISDLILTRKMFNVQMFQIGLRNSESAKSALVRVLSTDLKNKIIFITVLVIHVSEHEYAAF